MARRSAQNPRYRKDAQVGSTRKSAASAKPKREAGVVASPSKKSGAKKPVRLVDPDTPEFKRWRKIWLGLLVAAIVFSLGAYALREARTVNTLSLAFAYSCLFSAFYVDLTKIRRMRREFMDEQAAGGKKKSEKAEELADAATGSDAADSSASDETTVVDATSADDEKE